VNDPNGELGHVIILTGLDPITFEDGGYIKGEKGDKGTDGRGITKIYKKADFGDYSKYIIEFTDNTTTEYLVYHGKEGAAGKSTYDI
jgi:hypothetical protein